MNKSTLKQKTSFGPPHGPFAESKMNYRKGFKRIVIVTNFIIAPVVVLIIVMTQCDYPPDFFEMGIALFLSITIVLWGLYLLWPTIVKYGLAILSWIKQGFVEP